MADARDELIADLTRRLDAALKRIAELEALLGQRSGNSSKPPSSDPPWERGMRVRKPPTGRKPGGQAGHERRTRALVESDRVDHFANHEPVSCEGCGASLGAAPRDGDPTRHQVVELPEIRALVTEHRRFARRCACGRVTRARLPVGVPRTHFGPRLLATVVQLSGRYRNSRREVGAIFDAIFGIKLSVGAIDNACALAGELLAPAVGEVADAVARADVVNADETGFPCAGSKGWLWVAASPRATLFRLTRGRGTAFAKSLLGNFAGVLGTDRWGAYAWYDPTRRQLCWAHIDRNLRGIVDSKGPGLMFGQAGILLVKEMFALWHEHKANPDRSQLRHHMRSVQQRWDCLLVIHAGSQCPKTRGLIRDMTKDRAALWTFVERLDVEPTNNTAERAIRPAVLWRKGSFGSKSLAGATFVEGILTAAATCRQIGRSLHDFLVATFAAHQARRPAPALLAGP